ncbi:MAG: hypothetical protein ACKOX3_07650 [Bacteroidota bacterium]
MLSLSQNWITEGHIDLEYKKYVVLAYLQQIENELRENKLFPSMSEVLQHHRHLLDLRLKKDELSKQFPKVLNGMMGDGLSYQSLVENDQLMNTIQDIIDFSLPLFQKYVEESKRIAQFVEKHLSVNSVGLIPMRTVEGYLMITTKGVNAINVYQYQVSLFDVVYPQYPSIQLKWTSTYEYTLSNTFEKIKLDLIRNQAQYPNPATYCICSDFQFPLSETLLPLAKISLSKHLSQTVH